MVFGQTPYMERKVTVSLKGETAASALRKVSLAGGFVFSYNPDILDQDELLTHEFVNRSVREVLDELFKGDIQYKARGRYIILTKSPKTSSRKEPAVVSGYVVDESTGERLKDVSVYDPVTLTSTITDSYGYFEIKVDRPASDIILSVNRQHYTDTVFAVSDDKRLLNIPLRVNKDKLAVFADSVNQKLKRIWRKQETWFNNINLRNIDDSLYRTFQASLVPFVGTNHKMSAHVTNDYSLNLVGGYSLGVRKVEVGGVINLVRGDVRGFQAAGIFNGVGGETNGFQLAGVANANEGVVRGSQFAGVLNLNADESKGLSVAGVGNIAWGPRATGQLAGVFNVARREVEGAQIGGVFNFAGKKLKGTQVSGVLNVVGQEVWGAQIAGVINVAPRVYGTQIGLINVADSLRGVPVGLLSFVARGYHKIEVSADEIFYNNIAFRTGVRQFYNILTVGANPSTYGDEKTLWSFGYGLGTSSRLTRWLFLDFDLISNQIVDGNTIEALNLLNKAYLGVDIQAFRKVSLSVGVTLNGHITETSFDGYPELFTHYQPDVFFDRNVGGDYNLKMWFGAKVGVRFL